MRLLITAGPTREPIDAVRFISNRSSGGVGLAIADAARAAGHTVTLLLGAGITAPGGDTNFNVHRFQNTADLEKLLDAHFPHCDAVIMAAAVSDYRPVNIETGKRARAVDKTARWTLDLEPTPDLIAALGARKQQQKIIAFALESPDQLIDRARAKLQRKRADAIVANPLDTMESDHIDPTWITATDSHEAPGPMTKPAFADWLLARIERL